MADVDRVKERERTYIANEVRGLALRIQSLEGRASKLSSASRSALDGSASDVGNRVLRDCQAIEGALGRVAATLSRCSAAVREIDVGGG